MLSTKLTKPFFMVASDNVERYMLEVPSDFMLWLGDYLYYLKKDFASPEGMWKRQIKTRKRKDMKRFLMSRPQYSIWDDHDYGSYDGDASFEFKDTSLVLFKNFWPNNAYGTPNTKGIFTHFKKYDAEFFLTDDRFYRSESHKRDKKDGTMLGKEQLYWLKEALKNSDATFKFIAMGSQVLSLCHDGECYNEYPNERTDLLDFIKNNHITGVIFLTGDTHYSELLKLNREGTYPLYDFTCSPISSFLGEVNTDEKNDPMLVPGTLVKHRNFSRVSIDGTKGKRVCEIELFNDKAKLLWKYTIPESELK